MKTKTSSPPGGNSVFCLIDIRYVLLLSDREQLTLLESLWEGQETILNFQTTKGGIFTFNSNINQSSSEDDYRLRFMENGQTLLTGMEWLKNPNLRNRIIDSLVDIPAGANEPFIPVKKQLQIINRDIASLKSDVAGLKENMYDRV